MLNRRLLRVKVLQALYAYFQSSGNDINKAEKELFMSIERIYELYLHILILPVELKHFASLKLEDSKNKVLPTEEDLKSSNNFIQNQVTGYLEENTALSEMARKKGVSWAADRDLISRVFKKIKESSAYHDYILKESVSFDDDREFLQFIFKNIIFKFELISQSFHERSIHWSDDEFDYACQMVRNTIKKIEENNKHTFLITSLYKDEEDDREFVRELFRQTIQNNAECEKMIAEKTKNWEIERIAVIDIIMMKMALSELMFFKSIPVKVSLNEYIEISKFFSSPKSNTFINGILDKIVPELKEKRKIVKTGRGLME